MGANRFPGPFLLFRLDVSFNSSKTPKWKKPKEAGRPRVPWTLKKMPDFWNIYDKVFSAYYPSIWEGKEEAADRESCYPHPLPSGPLGTKEGMVPLTSHNPYRDKLLCNKNKNKQRTAWYYGEWEEEVNDLEGGRRYCVRWDSFCAPILFVRVAIKAASCAGEVLIDYQTR